MPEISLLYEVSMPCIIEEKVEQTYEQHPVVRPSSVILAISRHTFHHTRHPD